MDWAEWAHEMVYEDFVTKMLCKDWLCIKEISLLTSRVFSCITFLLIFETHYLKKFSPVYSLTGKQYTLISNDF